MLGIETPIELKESEKSDYIIVEEGLSLPETIKISDFQEAINYARAIENQPCRLIVSIKNHVEVHGKGVGGFSTGRFIFISASWAKEVADSSLLVPGCITAPAHQQLWACAFEEALHSFRKISDKDQGSYFILPNNPSEHEIVKYLSQEQESVVDKALNGGILRAKFGSGVFFGRKMVLHI